MDRNVDRRRHPVQYHPRRDRPQPGQGRGRPAPGRRTGARSWPCCRRCGAPASPTRSSPELAAQTPRVLEAIAALSAELGLTVVGSLPELVDGKVCNTSYVTDRGVLVGRYRKLHLFSLMNEQEHIAAGEHSVVVDTSVGQLGLAVCYDLRFPELFRKLALDGAEIICLPGEWPVPRQLHWRTLLRARAIENQCFVVAANCCGRQGKLDFFGMSLIIAPRGELLAEADDFATELVATCDFRELADYRAQITCFADRRPDVYGTLP